MNVYWLEQTAGSVPAGDEWLSGDECGVLAGLHVAKRRADWRLGRWTAKCAVASRLGIDDPRAIEIRPAASGAPRAFVWGRPAGVAISISHSRDVGFCAVAEGGAVGCDVEGIEPRSAAFLADYFSTDEQAIVLAAPAAVRDALVTYLWSAKESVLKALEYGLRADLRSVHVASAESPSTAWTPFAASAGGRTFAGWGRIDGGMAWTVAPAAGLTRLRLCANHKSCSRCSPVTASEKGSGWESRTVAPL